MAYEQDGINQIEVNELYQALEKKNEKVVLLDVRENEEYNAGHIEGVKIIPTSQFMDRYEQELEKDKEYIVICRSGNRSQMVCKFLQDQGFKSLSNYAGGMLEWDGPVEAGDSPVADGSRWK